MSQDKRKQDSGGDRQTRDQTARTKPQKRRRKHGVGAALLYVAFVIGVSTLLATMGWVAANDVLALNKPMKSAVITIEEVDTFGKVANDLKSNGIIEFKFVFHLFAMVTGAKDKIAPGTYQLTTDMDYRAIITNLGAKSASRQKLMVTIPEGYTMAQIFQRLEEQGVSTVEKLETQASTYDYAFSFLQDIPLGMPSRLEGYLFPDTYEFYTGEDPKTVLNKMLVNFDKKLTGEMRAQAANMERSIYDIVTIASMIEKETDGTDQTHISSVIYNRLRSNEGGTNGFLQIDAAIAYVTGRVVTESDYATVDSPYNTYLNKGLPPGAIANPGLAAIRSALNPMDTKDFYYVLGNDGLHHFFKTHKGQLEFIAQQKAERG